MNTVEVSVDLVDRLLRADEPKFTRSGAENAVRRYLMFLELIRRHPDRRVAPTRDVDEVWHAHMLCPAAYFEDCTRLFGEIIDHDAGFGATEEERPELERLFAETAALWKAEFGEAYVLNGAAATSCRVACRKSCSSTSRCIRACRKACSRRN